MCHLEILKSVYLSRMLKYPSNQISIKIKNMKKLITTSLLSLLMVAGAYAQNCFAQFSYSNSPANPLMVQFTNSSTTSNLPTHTTIYDWSFGDGNSSTVMSPTHTYSAAGTYMVCMIVAEVDSNGQWSCYDSTCVNLTVTGSVPNPLSCNASFWVDSNTTNASGINIYNNSTPVASATAMVAYAWDFGDGNTSSLQYPSHQYASSGLYNVCLTIAVSDSGRTCTDTYCMLMGVDSAGNVFYKNGPGFKLNVFDPATVGMNENVLNQVSFFPNPASDKVSIDLGASIDGEVNWSIFDLKGAKLGEGEISEVRSDISLANLNNGIYVLRIESGASVSNHKLQIVK